MSARNVMLIGFRKNLLLMSASGNTEMPNGRGDERPGAESAVPEGTSKEFARVM